MNENLITKAVTASGICSPQDVSINDKAATRAAIISFVKKHGIQFIESSQWGAKPAKNVDNDWFFKSIALHHAGNSFSCSVDNLDQLQSIEKTDVSKFKHLSYHYAISCDGKVYELLDIRFKGAHISRGNTQVIGIVMMADLSHAGEAYEQEYKNKGWGDIIKKSPELINDQFDNNYDTVSKVQENALITLVAALKKYFAMNIVGGHKEFQVLANKEGRACPGTEGMKIVKNLRSKFSFIAPSSSNYPHK
jgi:hypothetical protein